MIQKYKNMIQFVTICDDFYGKLMSYDAIDIPKCAQGSILHAESWVIINTKNCVYGRESYKAFCAHDIVRS